MVEDVKIENLRQRSLRSGTVTVGNQALRFVLQTGSTMVLARLLTPGDFGLVAMVYSLLGFVIFLKDFGLSVATIQKPEITTEELSGLFWVNVLLGGTIFAALALLAPLVAAFYHEPRAADITLAFGVISLVGSFGVQHAALLERQMRFELLAVRDLAAVVIGILAGVLAALGGLQFWALVIKEAATVACGTAFLWYRTGWLPGLPRKGRGLRKLVRFGGSLTIANVLGFLGQNLANVLFGKLLGETAVGFYSRGQALLNKPLGQVLPPTMRVATPMFARLAADRQRFERAVLRMVQIVSFGGCLLPLWFLPSADWVVQLMLGGQWTETIPVFQLLAVFGLMEPLAYLLGTVMVADGRPAEFAKWRAVAVAALLAGILAGLPWGIVGVAAAYTASGLVTRAWLIFYVGRCTRVSPAKMLRRFVPFVLCAALGVGLIRAARTAWEPQSALLGLLLTVLIGTPAYLALVGCTTGGRRFLAELFGMGRESLDSWRRRR